MQTGFTKKTLPAFKNFLRSKRLKESTVKRHYFNTRLLLPHLHKIDQYFDQLLKEGKTPSYLTSLVCSIRRIGQFTNNEKFTKYPFFGRNTRYIRATLSIEEIEAFLNLKPNGCQDKKRFYMYSLFFKILTFCGARPGEIAHLTTDCVDFGRKVFLIEDTKVNKPRLVPIPPNLTPEIQEHTKNLPNHLLFPKKQKTEKPISNVEWQYAFSTRIKRLGFKRKNLVPYSLRHSFATRLVEADVNLFKIKSILGHSSVRQTEHYYHSSTKALQDTIKQDPMILKEENKVICPICHGRGFYIKPE